MKGSHRCLPKYVLEEDEVRELEEGCVTLVKRSSFPSGDLKDNVLRMNGLRA
jgi:hypothetical protein